MVSIMRSDSIPCERSDIAFNDPMFYAHQEAFFLLLTSSPNILAFDSRTNRRGKRGGEEKQPPTHKQAKNSEQMFDFFLNVSPSLHRNISMRCGGMGGRRG